VPKTDARCGHRFLEVRTEKGRCSWVVCDNGCGAKGPKKHSVALALIAWVLYISSDHPKRRKKK
jgi:hypothetical protein